MKHKISQKVKVDLTNSFHNTTTRVVATEDILGRLWLTSSQIKRARRKLCGIAGCTCGDDAGCRPNQVSLYPDGDGVIIEK